ncbi:MAG: sulfurtransferase TusA family protein [Planctomycetes bacterium]|nr:sulfurtransferase TusA family protein [Planctomycetota bacterium]
MDQEGTPEIVPPGWDYAEVFDALDLGCGQLLLDLLMFIRPLEAGTVILLASRDIASPLEIPAWCRLTGNRLIEARPPYYLVEKKTNHP